MNTYCSSIFCKFFPVLAHQNGTDGQPPYNVIVNSSIICNFTQKPTVTLLHCESSPLSASNRLLFWLPMCAFGLDETYTAFANRVPVVLTIFCTFTPGCEQPVRHQGTSGGRSKPIAFSPKQYAQTRLPRGLGSNRRSKTAFAQQLAR